MNYGSNKKLPVKRILYAAGISLQRTESSTPDFETEKTHQGALQQRLSGARTGNLSLKE